MAYTKLNIKDGDVLTAAHLTHIESGIEDCSTNPIISSVDESTVDGGNNIITFSDGKTITIKNGNTGTKGDRGINGLGIYKSSEKNLQETDNKILFSKITNYNRDISVGDFIILNDLSGTLTIVKEINEDSVTVLETQIELQGKDGWNGKNGSGIFTARRTVASPDGSYDASIIDYPNGREPVVGDLLIFDDYGIAKITEVSSLNEIYIENTNLNIKGATGESITISEIIESGLSNGINTVYFSDGNILSVKNGKDGTNGTSITIQNISQTIEPGEISTVTFSDGKKLEIVNGRDGTDGRDGTNGYSGVYVGSSELPTNANVKIDPNGEGSVLIIPDVLQTTGDSEVDTMSQKAITELLNSIGGNGGSRSGESARSIVSIKRTSGNGGAGSTDTYTITYTDGTTSTFTVYNGKDGANGKTAYESAKSGGYTGTEANFNTALNNVTKYSTETWTFTLEDGSTVTKKVAISS